MHTNVKEYEKLLMQLEATEAVIAVTKSITAKLFEQTDKPEGLLLAGVTFVAIQTIEGINKSKFPDIQSALDFYSNTAKEKGLPFDVKFYEMPKSTDAVH